MFLAGNNLLQKFDLVESAVTLYLVLQAIWSNVWFTRQFMKPPKWLIPYVVLIIGLDDPPLRGIVMDILKPF